MFFVGVDIEYFFPHNMCCAYMDKCFCSWAIGGGWNLRQCIWYVQIRFMLIKSTDLCESSWFDRYTSVHRYEEYGELLVNIFTYT